MGTVPSARQSFFLAALASLFILIVSFVTDVVSLRYPSWKITDDLILAVVAAIVVYRYEKERSRFFSERLRVIREMNAFVRNELQLLYAALAGSEKSRVQAVERGVERIDWALRELLPGGRISPAFGANKQEDMESIKRSA
jgi:hypothetical protein